MATFDHDFLIRPLGALYFGKPQSFFAGESHRARSLFPPPQTAFQGMVRSQLLRAAGIDFERDKARISQLVGDPDVLPAGWQLQGPFPAQVKAVKGGNCLQPWLPTPRFVLRTRSDNGKDGLLCGRPLDHAGGLPMCDSLTSAGLLQQQPVLIGRPDRDDVKGPAEGWLAPQLLYAILSGATAESSATEAWSEPWPPFVKPESRPGLALGRPGNGSDSSAANEGVAQHGMLYFLEHLRIVERLGAPAGFYGHLSAPDMDKAIPPDALAQSLGAAGHKGVPVAFESTPVLDKNWKTLMRGDHLPQAVAEDQRFWLVNFTPVRMENPWQPLRAGVLPADVALEVEAVLSGAPVTFGGLRMVDRRARSNRAFLSAGTSWLIRLHGGNDARRAEALRNLNAAHPMGDEVEAAFGAGFTLAGICKEDEQ